MSGRKASIEDKSETDKYKHKSGAEKRKLKNRTLLSSAANNPKQKKLSFCGRRVVKNEDDSNNNQNKWRVSVQGDLEVSVGNTIPEETIIDNEEMNHGMGENEDPKLVETIDATTSNAIPQGPAFDLPVFPTDKALYISAPLTPDDMQLLVTKGACQPKENDMPLGKFPRNSFLRHFLSSSYLVKNALNEYVTAKWLAYSFRGDYAYCHYCWLFGDKVAKNTRWGECFNDWQHLPQSMALHARSKCHIRSNIAALSYASNRNIESCLNKEVANETRKWQQVLTIIIDVVRSLSGLGMPFRGHSERLEDSNCGVYLTILKLIARHNPTFDLHIKSQNRIKYISKTITDELISILARETRNALLSDCKDAKLFTLIADSTTDITHVDQMAILLRYVSIDRTNKDVRINESFISFIDIQQADANSLKEGIVKLLFEEYSLNPKYLCGQGYDGASVMSGSHGGLQAKIKQHIGNTVYAPYVHYPAHQINLVLMHAAENTACPSIKCFFATIQSIYTFFAFSNRRWANLIQKSKYNSHLPSLHSLVQESKESHSDSDQEDENENPPKTFESRTPLRIVKIKPLCSTRWAAHLKATEAMKANFIHIIECLEDETIAVRSSGDDILRAKSNIASMDFVFYLNLLWWHNVLSIMDATARILQKKSIDLFIVAETFKATVIKLKTLRSDTAYNTFINEAKQEWQRMGQEKADFPEKRLRRVKRMDGESTRDEALTPVQKHRLVYFGTLDNMLGELEERSRNIEDVCGLFGFLQYHKLKCISNEEIERQVTSLMQKYPFFTTDLMYNIIAFKTYYFETSATEHLTETPGVSDYMNFVVVSSLEDVIPEMSLLLRLFLTLPIGSSSAERCISTLRRVKNYMRSTMTQHRLSDLAILAIEKEATARLNLTEVIDNFSTLKARRGIAL